MMDEALFEMRPGEAAFAADPALTRDASLAFIGRVASPWQRRGDCPKNLREARDRSVPAALHVDAPYRAALQGLEPGRWIFALTWLDRARRDLALQTPRHAAEPRGTFTLRSPVRPNPIGLHLVRIVELDIEAGRVGIDAIDVLDGTPLLDIKPFFETVDVPPATEPHR
ncbi:tRNA (N6-threonylcarbamoyladenosine(37)-N6)-methyltransferase TrmO [Aurantimonas sp. MSK8Z-1]|uniref:tRNA (N6-threonylcarbamoyladenosine(37)-N6)-methyltransferase TrmO n=1 Tax=Mangrovibrevibacter kandeliae TaxID=2968473 RepID=UPI0021195225|nr:tRNA (N6-threonylcarbamoyladenosine(37)-N6)-methyltransferase TrmO [Aurantimonas sp. MSK8Z-1]MCW4116658.1 tRNA (N6-threonylcarbamoyladenosine(37)-N6)-methyltransferase TrmO [Aurantimonas sp. MSK8Z-1]